MEFKDWKKIIPNYVVIEDDDLLEFKVEIKQGKLSDNEEFLKVLVEQKYERRVLSTYEKILSYKAKLEKDLEPEGVYLKVCLLDKDKNFKCVVI